MLIRLSFHLFGLLEEIKCPPSTGKWIQGYLRVWIVDVFLLGDGQVNHRRSLQS